MQQRKTTQDSRSMHILDSAKHAQQSMPSKAGTWVRAYNGVLGRQLECINASHNLIHVASHRGRVVQGQLELFVRADDEDRSDGQRQVVAVLVSRVQHAIPASLCCFEKCYDCIRCIGVHNILACNNDLWTERMPDLLDSNGPVSISNDREVNGDLVLTVGHNIIQPFVVAVHLGRSTNL